MCGICGVVQVGGEPRAVVAPAVLDRMTDSMTHRGPDDRDTLLEPGVAFGARRLSIVDVAGGHQPFVSEDGAIWGMQNGELYNHDELRRDLRARGHAFASRCDTEVIPHLYEDAGDAFVERLRGKFGIAVWDRRRRRAVLARDRLGVKPLYWCRPERPGDLVVFASELKSLLASGLVEPRLDHEAIDAYLRLGYVPGPSTPLAGVFKLPPGCRLLVDANGTRIERYWSYPEPSSGAPEGPVEEYAERLLDVLRGAVRDRLMSDVPLGAMLSGGLDSSLIVALMAEATSEPVKTFSIGFAGAAGNELADARLVASALGTDHHELELELGDPSTDLEELAWHMDEPVASLSALGFHSLSRLAAQHVTVALSGQGADELLGGYRKHLAAAMTGRVPRPLAALGRHVLPRGRATAALGAADPVSRLLAMSGRLDDGTRARLARGSLAALDGGAARRAIASRLNGAGGHGPLSETLYLDAQLALVDDMLHYFDRTSMAHSLEVRVPFLDHRVVEFCATIPDAYKVRRLTTKYVLKRAAAGLVPDQVIAKRKVGFFHRTIGEWFERQMGGAVADYLLDPSPRYAELLDRTEVARLVAEQRAGRGAGQEQVLLGVLMLEIWLRSYLPRALAPQPAPLRARPDMVGPFQYAAITPARDEVDNLERLAESLAAQTVAPVAWVIVDNGSRDGTVALARRLARHHARVRVLEIEGERDPVRGRPIVRAMHAGVRSLEPLPEIVVMLDADISFGPDYFERLLAAFAADARLGIASGSGWELEDGAWRQRHLTGSTVWGASRAYRRECLEAVLPFEERLGWDGIDEFKANARGWTTRTLVDLPFRHHRREGARDGAWRMRVEQGRAAHYVGYRPWYLTVRALHHARREPSALGLLWGYAAAFGKEERLADAGARAYVKRQQSLRNVPQRALEALGRRAA